MEQSRGKPGVGKRRKGTNEVEMFLRIVFTKYASVCVCVTMFVSCHDGDCLRFMDVVLRHRYSFFLIEFINKLDTNTF